jgi:AraC-like DNA-binding protein
MSAGRASRRSAILDGMKDGWRPVDPLGEALHFLRMSGTFYCRSEMTAPWGLALPPRSGSLSFHVVLAGSVWLTVDDHEPEQLQPGELVLVPHGRGHRLTSEPGGAVVSIGELQHEYLSDRYGVLRAGGGGAPSTLVCGAVRFDHPAAHHLVSLLPRLIRVRASGSGQLDWLDAMLRFMATEARELRPGGETIITRLADILVIQAIRSWIAEDPAAQTGWLGALQDAQIGRAIALIHRDPSRAWTVSSLAGEVAMSRSAFAARFTQLVGEPAMHYLARWRMHVALTWLNEEGLGLGEMASRLGYRSEAAFSRAFKRFIGVSPGAARRGAQPGEALAGSS